MMCPRRIEIWLNWNVEEGVNTTSPAGTRHLCRFRCETKRRRLERFLQIHWIQDVNGISTLLHKPDILWPTFAFQYPISFHLLTFQMSLPPIDLLPSLCMPLTNATLHFCYASNFSPLSLPTTASTLIQLLLFVTTCSYLIINSISIISFHSYHDLHHYHLQSNFKTYK